MQGRGEAVKASSADVTRTRGQTASSPRVLNSVDDPSTTSSESAITACRNDERVVDVFFMQSSFFLFFEKLFSKGG